jgi:signal transduction histidine kinase
MEAHDSHKPSNTDSRVEPPNAAAGAAEAYLASVPVPLYVVSRDLKLLFSQVPAALRGISSLCTPLTDTGILGVERTRLLLEVAATLDESKRRPDEDCSPCSLDVSTSDAGQTRRWRLLASRVEGSEAVLLTCIDLAATPGTHADSGHDAARLEVARQLAATLNHEINNPLFIVSATLEDLQAEATDPDSQRRLTAALDAVWRVASAVKQLQEIRQVVSTTYIEGFPMIDLEASLEPRR